jgi:methyltransferase (TIGR00027 family)
MEFALASSRIVACYEGTMQVTDTAAAIARIRAREGERPVGERLFEDPFAAHFFGGEVASEVTDRFLSVPFFVEQVRLRTRYIDDFLRAGLRDGVDQIVVVGAGFDCRPLRLPEIRACGATTFEIDLDAQLAAKRAILAAAGVAIPASVRFVPCDLGATGFAAALADALARAGLDRRRRVLIVCEGVLSYLDDASVDELLSWMATLGAGGSRAVLNYPISRFDPERCAARLSAAGLATDEHLDLDAVHHRYLPAEPAAGGDFHRIASVRTR